MNFNGFLYIFIKLMWFYLYFLTRQHFKSAKQLHCCGSFGQYNIAAACYS